MGTSFFRNAGPKFTGGGNPGLESRAMGAAVGAQRGAAMGAQKSLASALALNKHPFKPNPKSGAYPPGPKI